MQDGQGLCSKRAVQVSVCSLRRVLLSKGNATHQKRGACRQACLGQEKEPAELSSNCKPQRFSKPDRLADHASEASFLVQPGWWWLAKASTVSQPCLRRSARCWDERWWFQQPNRSTSRTAEIRQPSKQLPRSKLP